MRMIKSLSRLYEQLRKLPGVGSKTALRLAYHIMDMSGDEVAELARALVEAKKETRFCARCFNLSDEELCEICRRPERDGRTICVVEQPQDVAALERGGKYGGVYHVLRGVLSPMDGVSPEQLKLRELIGRINDGDVREVIVATNSDIEGDATAVYIAKLLKPLGVEVTRIAHGLPAGGDLEYADGLTLSLALENRRKM
ncbi:MAG: recombination mediator RecR [Acidaminococcales bacterium]|jgi:recombination protein RecR|nr:recombination mediator RecR [Acidaminococcales bacterium]